MDFKVGDYVWYQGYRKADSGPLLIPKFFGGVERMAVPHDNLILTVHVLSWDYDDPFANAYFRRRIEDLGDKVILRVKAKYCTYTRDPEPVSDLTLLPSQYGAY